jgi:hypothetical protein
MPKIPMIWTGPDTRYGGRFVRAGQEFLAHECDVRVLHATKRADFAPASLEESAAAVDSTPTEPAVAAAVEQPAPFAEAEVEVVLMPQVNSEVPDGPSDEPAEVVIVPADQVQEAAPEAADATEQVSDSADISPRTGKAKRAYRRRDMAAEGSGD